MSVALNLGNELLIDRDTVQRPELRLLLAVLGQPLLRGSSWVVVPSLKRRGSTSTPKRAADRRRGAASV